MSDRTDSSNNYVHEDKKEDNKMNIIKRPVEFVVPKELVSEFWKVVEENKIAQTKAKKTDFSEMKPYSKRYDKKK